MYLYYITHICLIKPLGISKHANQRHEQMFTFNEQWLS